MLIRWKAPNILCFEKWTISNANTIDETIIWAANK